jgi:hypothetical protein
VTKLRTRALLVLTGIALVVVALAATAPYVNP